MTVAAKQHDSAKWKSLHAYVTARRTAPQRVTAGSTARCTVWREKEQGLLYPDGDRQRLADLQGVQHLDCLWGL